MRSHPLLPVGLLVLALAGCAGDPFDAYAPVDGGAIQHPHPAGDSRGVPQVDRSGAMLTAYDPARSFFPLALGGALVDYSRGVARGFVAAQLADFNAVTADPQQPLDMQLAAADGSRLLLLRARPDAWGELRHAALLDASDVAVIAMPRAPGRCCAAQAEAFTRSARQEKTRPVWALLPANARTGNGENLPTPAEARLLAFAALTAGVTGVIWQGEDNYAARNAGRLGIAAAPQLDYGIQTDGTVPPLLATPEDAAASRRLWDAVMQLNRRIARITPVLLRPDAGESYSIAARIEPGRGTAPQLRSLLKPHDDGLLLILVNLADRPEDIRVAFSRGLRSVAQFDTAAPVTTDTARGLFSDRIEAQGVRLYRIALAR